MMDEDYESAKRLLENLKKKYSTKNTSGDESKDKICNKPSTSNTQTLEDLKKKYLTKNTSENKVEIQKKRKKISKEGTGATKLSKRGSSTSNKSEVVTVIIDTNISDKYGLEITEKLQESQIFYKFDNQICTGLITWQRSCSTHDITAPENTKEAIIIIHWEDLITYIKSSELLSHVKSLQEILIDKRIFLGIFGMDNYFRYWNAQRAGNMSKVDEKRLAEYKNCTKISKGDFEIALTELQLACSCCYRLLNSPQDIIDLILQFTKSITQLPEKLEKREKYKDYEWHMLKDNRDCVPVDKNGNGLQRLWQQQLTSFEMARLETAEAVIAQYSTPSKLYEAYNRCSELEGQKLLENIPVRRSAGPLTASRKVGPELSSKVYTFFNSTDGDIVL